MLRPFLFSVLGGLAITSILGLSSCAGPERGEAQTATAKFTTVAVAKIARENLSRDLVLSAEFRPYQEVAVHAKVAGYLKEIYVDVGDRAQKGQLLATLEIPELEDELRQVAATEKRSEAEIVRARAELQRTEAAHEEAHLSYNRLASVMQSRPNLVAQNEIDAALARDRVTEAQISAAQAALAVTEQDLAVSKANREKIRTLMDYSRITAPFSGVVTKRFADVGAMIQAGTASQTQALPVVRLSQNDRLRLVLPVPESVVPQIRLGTPVEVGISALGKTFQGTVARFSGKVETSTRTMQTEVDVPNPGLDLKPGMYAYAKVTLDRREGALAVPLQALSGHENEASVFVVNEKKKIEERTVKLGIESPTKREVLSGLQENDLVIIGNRNQLKPGQTVEPKLVEIGGT